MFSIGVSIIVRDGMDTLPALMEDIRGCMWIDEIVVVDTGSTDGTWEWVQDRADEDGHWIIKQIEWKDDFSYARNVALSLATTEWVMWLDADDRLPYAGALQRIHELENPPNAFYAPYHYVIDVHGNTTVVQKRERLVFRPENWVWKNPVHEVLEYVGEGEARFETLDTLTIEHHPVRGEGYSDRNWNILTRHYIENDGNVGPFMQFYLAREADVRGDTMFANDVATRLIDNPLALPFHKYEAYLVKARAYRRIGRPFTYVKGVYLRAIQTIPELNEAKAEYINWLLEQEHVLVAQEMVNELSLTVPETVGVVNAGLYGSYVHALRAMVDLKSGQNLGVVMTELLMALNYPSVHPLCHTIDNWVREKIKRDRVGIMFAEPDYYATARELATELENADVFAEVLTFTNPLCANYANEIYFHFGDKASLYKEETDPYTTRVLLTKDVIETSYLFGWDYIFETDADFDFSMVMATVFNSCELITAPTIEEGIEKAKALKSRFVILLSDEHPLTAEDIATVEHMLFERPNEVIAISEYPLYGIACKTDKLISFMANKNQLLDFSIERVACSTLESDAPGFGTNWSWVTCERKKTVYIYAEGVEPWDGCTPYARGIGASEASVVYLAEQLALTHKVYVFSPTYQVRTISGVVYVPNTEIGRYPVPDVLISSRCPHILTERIAKRQILWLHDLYQHTKFPEGMVADRIICVSEQEAEKAEVDWGTKVRIIPNPYKPNTLPSSPIKDRAVWLSSPDRGIMNLLDTELKDIWLTYSYFNMRVMRQSDPVQFQRIWQEKYTLRQHGVKLVGRLGLRELRHLLSFCDVWPYASDFEETFCVSALEAVGAGLYPLVTTAGATVDTLKRYHNQNYNDQYYSIDGVRYSLKFLTVWLCKPSYTTRSRNIEPDVLPENVCKTWCRILQ